jgi:maltose O-acetyltransferase
VTATETDEQPRPRAAAREELARPTTAYRLFALRLVNYITNELISHVPSFALRRWWYTRVAGISFGHHSGIHLGCYLWSYGPRQARRDQVSIGSFCRINRNCLLDVRGSLTIADNVSMSPEVMILTAYHRPDKEGFPVEGRPVVIEDHVWIGTRAMIMPGVTLGRGCVVAAGAVVTRDVPPMAMVAGVPARVVNERPAEGTNYNLSGPFPLFE